MSKPELKIIIFDGSFKTTTFINRLASGLSKNHSVYILGFNETINKRNPKLFYVPLGSNQNYLRFIWVSLKYSINNIGHFKKALKYLFLKKRIQLQQQNLEIALKKIDPDIIHLQWLSNLKWFEPYLEKQEYNIILSQRGFHVNVRPFVNKDNFAYLKKWYPKISGFHSVSNSIKSTSNKIFPGKDQNDQVVYSGFDLSKFKFKDDYFLNESCIKLVSIGRNHWVKGYDFAIKVMNELRKKRINFHYTIIGAEKDEELLYLINHFKLENYITLAGRVSQEEVYKEMKNNDFLFMPSIAEGLPNVCVEAMAIGIPVITYNCGGVEELIENNVNGFIFYNRDISNVANLVSSIFKLPQEDIEDVRKSALNRVLENHNEKKMINDMENLYHSILQNNIN